LGSFAGQDLAERIQSGTMNETHTGSSYAGFLAEEGMFS
jgi:hypothetical protein